MSESAVFAVILLNSYFLFYNLSVPAVTSRLFPGFIIFIFYKITEYCHSFNEPSITPFTKYFWKNGYVNRTGSVVNIIIAYFNCAPDIFLPFPPPSVDPGHPLPVWYFLPGSCAKTTAAAATPFSANISVHQTSCSTVPQSYIRK